MNESDTWSEGYHWLDVGRVSIELSTLAGAWLSLGVHISLIPPCLDIHLGWWVLSVMSRTRGDWIRGCEEAYRLD